MVFVGLAYISLVGTNFDLTVRVVDEVFKETRFFHGYQMPVTFTIVVKYDWYVNFSLFPPRFCFLIVFFFFVFLRTRNFFLFFFKHFFPRYALNRKIIENYTSFKKNVYKNLKEKGDWFDFFLYLFFSKKNPVSLKIEIDFYYNFFNLYLIHKKITIFHSILIYEVFYIPSFEMFLSRKLKFIRNQITWTLICFVSMLIMFLLLLVFS